LEINLTKVIVKYHPIPAIVSGFFILCVCLIPGNTLPKSGILESIFIDKWVHLFLYIGWTYIWFLGLQKLPRQSMLLKIVLFMAVYGAFIEVLQHYFVAGRSAEFLDWVADIAGIGVGYILWFKRK